MKTIKLTRIAQSVEEIEVSAPYFVKFGQSSYAVIFDEHTAIAVVFSKVANSSVSVIRPELVMKENPRVISSTEFLQMYEAATEDIKFTLVTKGKHFKN